MDSHLPATDLIAITLLTITPGVDTLRVIRNTARGGGLTGSVMIFLGLRLAADR